jgi:glucosamine--fructose-6-phosphate aminotransferase (isomerizing)
MSNATERSIFEQFGFWRTAPRLVGRAEAGRTHVVVGCGTSYNIAMSLAAGLNLAGVPAIAVPGGEWARRPDAFLPHGARAQVLALSRSGETTEAVQAAETSRRAGHDVLAITCARDGSLAAAADRVLFAPTHAEEGIVMTASASLMLLLGLRYAGHAVEEATVAAAEALLASANASLPAPLAGRTHFVLLGSGPLHGIAQEGALKLQEMSLSFAHAYHVLEFRHGPMSLVDEHTLVVLLYHPATVAEEAVLAGELSAKGARVIGIGGPGDLTWELAGEAPLRALAALPALQLLGERVAQRNGLDSAAPRHLSRVVRLA